MFIGRSFLWSVTIAVFMAVEVAAQQASPRDTFWSASDLISVTPNPAAAKAKTATPTSHLHPSGKTKTTTEVVSNPSGGSPQSAPISNAQLVSDNGYGSAPQLIRTAGNRLGLRYSLLMRGSDGNYSEVSPGTIFHSGDHIRISLLSNQPGYLYVIEQGSSGDWKAIFPPVTSPPDALKVEQGKLQIVPTGNRAFQFDQQPGAEKLFIILSRVPLSDLMREIQHLKDTNRAPHETVAEPSETLQAQLSIPDLFVQQLASRDLSLVDEQNVDEAPTATRGGEKAVYVVAKAQVNAPASELVTSIQLRHE
jgi:hypothetical protein